MLGNSRETWPGIVNIKFIKDVFCVQHIPFAAFGRRPISWGKRAGKSSFPPVAQSGLPDMPASIFSSFHPLSK
jgi:hypothetical protein